ncbi:Crp/Fnr family transcriptional regulator [Fusibacter sp. JL298sf-3]
MKRRADEGGVKCLLEELGIEESIDATAVFMCDFDTGETIYSRGDEAIYFYILVEGRLRVDRLYENGKEVLLKLYSPYNFIGDLEWAMNRFTIDNQVTAITKVTCAAIPMSAIEARQSFYEFVTRHLAIKLHTVIQNSAFNAAYPLPNRLASFLCAFLGDDDVVVLPIKYTELAALLSTTYRHLLRVFETLEQERVLTKSGKRLCICDKEALKALAVDHYDLSF